MAVITFSRQYGSGGNDVARLVCDRLGYRYFDKAAMSTLCKTHNLSCESLDSADEFRHRVRDLIGAILADVLGHEEDDHWAREKAAHFRAAQEADDLALELVQYVIQAAEELGNVAIMGRGSQAILQTVPGVVHVRIVAPLESRVQRIVARGEAPDTDAARDLANRLDGAATDYVRGYYGLDPADPLLYHLVINTGKVTLADAAELVVKALGEHPAAVLETPSEGG